MAVFRPFCAVRPEKNFAELVGALPYDVMNSEEARKEVQNNPYSFLHIDKAEVDLPEGIDVYSDAVYSKAAENLKKMSDNNILKKDEQPYFYIYRQIMGGISQIGLAGCAGIDDYLGNVIKKHELTRADKENDRIRHIAACRANTGPVFLAYKRTHIIDSIIDKYVSSVPEYDFVSKGGVRNTVWIISDKNDITNIENAFLSVPSLYIADGHHRAASAVKVAQQLSQEKGSYSGKEEFNFFLAVCFRADELNIFPYNRLLKNSSGLTKDYIFSRIEENFDILESKTAFAPECRHSFGFYFKNKWYRLSLRNAPAQESNILDCLDAVLLQKLIIEPIFGISDIRNDSRIDFAGGIRGLDELEKRCNDDMDAAFSMYPPSVDELMAVADSGMIMPPKSTWFEPKLLSGLFIHELL